MAIEDNASIALIPSGYKSGKLYSVIPDSGNGDFTHSRGSTATRVAASGLIETVASGVPRLDYPLIDGVVQDCPALLLEPSRTNLITYSEDFSDSSWTKLGAGTGTAATITSNYGISPDGSLNASRLQCDLNGGGGSSTNQSLIYNTYSSSGSQALSIYIKSNNGQNQTVYFANTQTTGDTVTVTTEWQRFTFTHSTTPYVLAVGLRGRSGGGINDTADILIWGAQAETGSYPTSYIPTSGSTVTRSADVCNGSGTSAEFNDSEGVLFVETEALANDLTYRGISIGDGTAANVVRIYYENVSNRFTANIKYAGVSQATFIYTFTDITINSKISVKYKENDFALWVNGFEVETDSSGSTPTGLDVLQFDTGTGGDDFYGKTKQLITFKTALNDSELETLVSWDSFNAMATGQLYTIE